MHTRFANRRVFLLAVVMFSGVVSDGSTHMAACVRKPCMKHFRASNRLELCSSSSSSRLQDEQAAEQRLGSLPGPALKGAL